ncbi:MAG: hemerythrin domain-containing protein [Chitinophagales bacterium]|nr:hemerythrin domain-containing protein [Chitinophagales bacterium]
MNRLLHQFFTEDHRRLDDLLERAIEQADNYQMEYYEAFRTGLLKHIKMEEKVLFPAAQLANGGVPLEKAAQLRLDHGALTALMVPTPFPDLIKVLKYILEIHDRVEEEEGGVYDICESLTAHQTQELLDQLHQIAEVSVHKHNDAPIAWQAAERAVIRAGYDFQGIISGKVQL